MSSTIILKYDGSFHGYLAALYQALQNPEKTFDIQREIIHQPNLFDQTGVVTQNMRNARTLWGAMQGRSIGLPRLIYFAFLSEHHGVETLVLEYLRSVFCGISPGEETRKEWLRKLTQWARQVETEKTDLENNILLTASRDRVPRCTIAPKHNVLPLLSRHFRTRFSGHAWIIFDRKRSYGLYGDSGRVEIFQSETGYKTHQRIEETMHSPIRPAV